MPFGQMDSRANNSSLLKGVVELDEKYFGGRPRDENGVQHNRAAKHPILVANIPLNP